MPWNISRATGQGENFIQGIKDREWREVCGKGCVCILGGGQEVKGSKKGAVQDRSTQGVVGIGLCKGVYVICILGVELKVEGC